MSNFSLISNLTKKKKKMGCYATSSGSYCQLLELKKKLKIALIKLPSNKKIYLSIDYTCLTGRNNNINKKYEIKGKASYKFFLGKNPLVRGVAKNPVDHPHGGRTKTVQPEVSPWGWVTKHSH